MLYAPDVGRLGLDMARKVSRIGAWKQVKKTQPLSNINSGVPWYPELGGYAVCCINDGMYGCNYLLHTCLFVFLNNLITTV